MSLADAMNVPISRVVPEKRVVACLKDTQTLGDAVRLLTETIIRDNKQNPVCKGILSAPVIRPKAGGGSGPAFEMLGFISMMDVMKCYHSNEQKGGGGKKSAPSVDLEQTLDKAIDWSARKPVQFLNNQPLSFVVDVFASGVRRSVIYTSETEAELEARLLNLEPAEVKRIKQEAKDTMALNGGMHCTMSQTDVLKYMVSQKGDLLKASFGSQSSEKVGACKSNVLKLKTSSTVLDAFELLVKENNDYVAVVDNQGKLSAEVSVSNFRGLTRHDFRFSDSIITFLSKHSPESLKPIKRKATDSFVYVCETMAKLHLHHVWIVGKKDKPAGIVSLTNVMQALSAFKPPASAPTVLKTPGTLHIKVVGATDLKSADLMGKSDPYVLIRFGDHVFRSPVEMKTLTPTWNFTASVPVQAADARKEVTVQVWDWDKNSSDDFLGATKLQMNWVLDGFGSKAASRFCQDVYLLDTKGALRIDLLYVEEGDEAKAGEEKKN